MFQQTVRWLQVALIIFGLQAKACLQVWGALYVLRVLTRKYEFKDEDERAPLAPVVNAAFPPLLAMLQVRLLAPLIFELCNLVAVTHDSILCTFQSSPNPSQVAGELLVYMRDLPGPYKAIDTKTETLSARSASRAAAHSPLRPFRG